VSGLTIRRARAGEEVVVLELLRELAEYEKLLDVFRITEEVIRRDYLCEKPLVNCDLALANGEPVGFASWYWTYASFAAARGIFLEDLYVRSKFRGKGYGKALLAHLAREAVAANAARVEWSVLDWNKPSIEFYKELGARQHDGWYMYRLENDALKKLGGG
jgi:GNAT superfamily N-acetyltransferase